MGDSWGVTKIKTIGEGYEMYGNRERERDVPSAKIYFDI